MKSTKRPRPEDAPYTSPRLRMRRGQLPRERAGADAEHASREPDELLDPLDEQSAEGEAAPSP